MQATEALRIARLALAMHFDIEPDVVAGRYVGAYVAATNNKRDIDAAEAYNKLAEMQQYEEYKLGTTRSNEKSLLFMARYGTTAND